MIQPIKNPYGHRGPIEDSGDFYGRAEVLSQLLEAIETRCCIALIGERRIGKTSILYQIRHRDVRAKYLANPDALLFAYIDGEKVQSPHDFFRQLFQLIGTQVPSLAPQWNDQLPISEASILLQQLRPRKLVILIDEFDHIVTQKVFPPGTFYQLRSIAQGPKSVCDVSLIVVTKRDLADDLVPEIETDDLAKAATYFLNIFSKCFIGSFTPAEFQFFLDETSHRTGVPLSQYKQQIEDLAGHFPFFVQIACYYYFDALVKNIKSLDHALARHRFMDEARSHFRYIWSHLDDHERDTVVALVEGKQLHQDKLWSLTRKGYVIDGALFSSAFAEFVKQEIGISHAKTGVSFDSDGNVRVVDDKRNKRVIPLERLARLERDLLRLLYEKKGKVCTYQEITDKVWAKHDPGYKGSAPPIDSIQQAVRRLRVKIEPDSDNPRFILTVGGEGYRLVDPQSHSVLLAAVGFLPTLLMLSKGMFKGVLAFGKGLLELARWTDEILAVTVVIVIVVIVVLVLIGKVNPAKIIELLKGLL